MGNHGVPVFQLRCTTDAEKRNSLKAGDIISFEWVVDERGLNCLNEMIIFIRNISGV